jgi:hypothetical protein
VIRNDKENKLRRERLQVKDERLTSPFSKAKYVEVGARHESHDFIDTGIK